MPAEPPAKVTELIAAALKDRPELAQSRAEQSAAESFARAEHDWCGRQSAMSRSRG
jgi:hypothetical protein